MSETGYDTIVIGAGFAGATAARDLADRGLQVILLEGSNRTGGRTYSRPFKGRTETIECGGTWVNPAVNPLINREVERYGIDLAFDEDEEPEGSTTFFTGGERRRVPIPANEISALERAWIHIHEASKRFTVGPPICDQPVADLDISAKDFFSGVNLPPATRDLLYGLIGGMIGGHPDQSSMLGPISKVAAFGSPYSFFAGGPRGTGYGSAKFRNGSAGLIDAMIDGSGVELRLRCRVTHVVHEPDRVTVTVDGSTEYRARGCIIAVPSNVIRKLEISPQLSEGKRALTADKHIGLGFKTYMIADKVPSAPSGFGMAPFQLVLPDKELEDGTWLLSGFGCNGIAPVDPNSREETEEALRWYFPDAKVLACDGHDWLQDPLFDGSWRLDPPGWTYDGPRIMKEPEGRLFFAGSDFDDSLWRISIEGAVHSGHRAAKQLADSMGISRI